MHNLEKKFRKTALLIEIDDKADDRVKVDLFNSSRSNGFAKTLGNLWRNDHFVKLNSRCDSSQGGGWSSSDLWHESR